MSDPAIRRTAREELVCAVGEAIFAEVKKFPTPPPWSGVVAPLGASVEDVGRAAMAVIDAAGWPDSETEWGWRRTYDKPDDVVVAFSEDDARSRLTFLHNAVVVSRPVGPWTVAEREVTS